VGKSGLSTLGDATKAKETRSGGDFHQLSSSRLNRPMKPPRNRQVKPPLLSPVSIQSENIQMDVHPSGNISGALNKPECIDKRTNST
jgi:hypothetical protein